jgi:hypothetical protein
MRGREVEISTALMTQIDARFGRGANKIASINDARDLRGYSEVRTALG